MPSFPSLIKPWLENCSTADRTEKCEAGDWSEKWLQLPLSVTGVSLWPALAIKTQQQLLSRQLIQEKKAKIHVFLINAIKNQSLAKIKYPTSTVALSHLML